jgi:hypothetical protein
MSNLNTTLATLAEQKDFLAIALIRFLDLTGGADGMSPGRGDPQLVRGLAVAALDKAGIAYGKSKVPLPGLDDAEYERQKGTLHEGGIRTPGFYSQRPFFDEPPTRTPTLFFVDHPGSAPNNG